MCLVSLRTMWPALLLTMAIVAIMLLTGKALLERFFPQYLAAYPILVVLVFVLAARTINVSLTALLNSRAKYLLMAKLSALNLAANIFLVLLLVPKLGALGAAWAALGTESVNTLLQGKGVISVFSGPASDPIARDVLIELPTD